MSAPSPSDYSTQKERSCVTTYSPKGSPKKDPEDIQTALQAAIEQTYQVDDPTKDVSQ